MTEMTARVRNRLQDGMINWQEKRFRKEDFRQQQADIHRSRMTCSASLPSFHQTQDWTGGIAVCGRKPVIEETKPARRVFSSEGIRWDAALTALIIAGTFSLSRGKILYIFSSREDLKIPEPRDSLTIIHAYNRR